MELTTYPTIMNPTSFDKTIETTELFSLFLKNLEAHRLLFFTVFIVLEESGSLVCCFSRFSLFRKNLETDCFYSLFCQQYSV